MTIREALKKVNNTETELLLAYVLKRPKEFLYMNGERRLTRTQTDRLTRMIKRGENGEPVAYILGYKDFMGLRLKVNKDALVPRPETEELVGKVLKVSKVHKVGVPLKILDVGTGSGCVAVSLAKLLTRAPLARRKGRPCFEFYASDISSGALKVAKQNAKIHNVKIKFIQSDLFKNIGGRFDVIIANLPYVPKEYYVSSIKYLVWEPKIALIDETKDFDIYERFLREVSGHLNPKGKIYLEIDPKAKALITKWQKKYLPKASAEFYHDFNNLWRYAEIKNI